MSDLKELEVLVKKFIDERDWNQFHTPKNIAMSISIEAAELMEIFQWYTNDESSTQGFLSEKKAEINDEVADVFIYLLSMAIHCDIDLKEIVIKKMERNQKRFPIDKVRGKLAN